MNYYPCFRYATILLFALVSPTFAAAVDALPYAEYISIPVALAAFSFLTLARFLSHFWKTLHFRKIFFASLTIILLYIGLTVIILYTDENITPFAFGAGLLTVVYVGGITLILGLIMGLIYIFKKDKFVIKSALSILAVEIIAVIFMLIFEGSSDLMLGMLFILLFLNAILGVISLIWLIIFIVKKYLINRLS